MARTINQVNNSNNVEYKVIMTFATQEMYDLWKNEMQGQISDGLWENSRKTEWLWRNGIRYEIGDTTKVEVLSGLMGRRRFFWTKELECIQDRAVEGNGFTSVDEMKKAWNTIAQAIYNAEEFKYESETYIENVLRPRQRAEEERKSTLAALKESFDVVVAKLPGKVEHSYGNHYRLAYDNRCSVISFELKDSGLVGITYTPTYIGSGSVINSPVKNLEEVVKVLIDAYDKLKEIGVN